MANFVHARHSDGNIEEFAGATERSLGAAALVTLAAVAFFFLLLSLLPLLFTAFAMLLLPALPVLGLLPGILFAFDSRKEARPVDGWRRQARPKLIVLTAASGVRRSSARR